MTTRQFGRICVSVMIERGQKLVMTLTRGLPLCARLWFVPSANWIWGYPQMWGPVVIRKRAIHLPY